MRMSAGKNATAGSKIGKMSKKQAYQLAESLQQKLRAFSQAEIAHAPRVMLDSWASLFLWHRSGEKTWRISEEQAERLLDDPLPEDLRLETAPTRGPAVLYQLPEFSAWIILARHRASAPVQVWESVAWAYAQPVLTYCTPLESGAIAAGYLNLIDQPTPGALTLSPGRSLTRGALTEAEITEEDFRLSLSTAQHYRP